MSIETPQRDDVFRGTRPADADPVGEMFASRTVIEHVARGIVGLILVVGGLAFATQSPWAMLAVIPGVVAWRGCPTCWTMGLIATISRGKVVAGSTCRR